MCGIFGFWCNQPDQFESFNAGLLRSATHALAHRGPDAEGLVGWSRTGQMLKNSQLVNQPLCLGLGHRRLSIIDLSDKGRQPMQLDDKYWIVYNGEIYNYKELRSELISLGYSFKTETDTEVILAGYSAWGEDCIKHFNGMWAFSLYDKPQHCLFARRDRLGIKPFYYVSKQDRFIFTSEVNALFQYSTIKPKIVKSRLIQCLIEGKIDGSPETIFEDIYELRGGHCMHIDLHRGNVSIWSYWDLPSEENLEINDDDALDHFNELIEDAVRLRLRADVPVSIMLSGGIDSSVITIAASRINNSKVQTFTSRFPNDMEIDESEYADQIAKACRINPNFIETSTDRMLEEEPLLTKHLEMPYGSLSLYVRWVIFRAIRSKGFPVVLSGQGADELFLGYERYYVGAALAQLPNAYKMIKAMIQSSHNSRLSLTQAGLFTAYFSLPNFQRITRLWKANNIYHKDLLKMLPKPQPEVLSDIRKLQTLELKYECLGHLLRYEDRTSSAHGLEVRLPFLDYRIVEFAYRLPLRHKIRDGWTKYLLRLYLARHGQSNIAWRKHKLGFNAPQSRWTKELVKVRGDYLQSIPFARSLIRDDVLIQNIPIKQRWDVYNTLHLAALMQWDWA